MQRTLDFKIFCSANSFLCVQMRYRGGHSSGGAKAILLAHKYKNITFKVYV